MCLLSLLFRPLQEDEGVSTQCHSCAFVVDLTRKKLHTEPTPVYCNNTNVRDRDRAIRVYRAWLTFGTDISIWQWKLCSSDPCEGHFLFDLQGAHSFCHDDLSQRPMQSFTIFGSSIFSDSSSDQARTTRYVHNFYRLCNNELMRHIEDVGRLSLWPFPCTEQAWNFPGVFEQETSMADCWIIQASPTTKNSWTELARSCSAR